MPSRYSLQLKSMYPDSAEYREFSSTSSER